jgi:glucose-6-phosphate 1-epimerase
MLSTAFEQSILRNRHGDSASICAHGAHLTSWLTADGTERLFLSQRAEFHAGAAIRGGVPIIFPQFAGLGALPKHGFARTATWQRVSESTETADCVLFRWQDDAATLALWPQQFVAEYEVTLGAESLSMKLSILNSGEQKFSFTAALHTYLRVQNIAEVMVGGLQGLRYSDSTAGGAESIQSATALRIDGEVDRIYFSTMHPITVQEPGQRELQCSAEGFTDTVVWNPGVAKAAALVDMEPEGYRHMLCIEAAAIGVPIVLQPQASWSGTQHLQLR